MNDNQNYYKIAISIVTFNSSHIIENLLKSIDGRFPVYIFDNSSKDTISEVTKRYNVNLYISGSNIGFGRGHNYNIRRILEDLPETEFIAIINPDIVLNHNVFDYLLDAANLYKDATLFAPRLLDGKGKELLTYKTSIFKRNKTPLNDTYCSGDLCAEFISGAFYFVRTEYLKKGYLFDEQIFLFHEDDDFCMRVYNSQSYGVVVYNATATHFVGKSSVPSMKTDMFKNIASTNSRIYLEKKYKGLVAANLLKINIFCVTLIKAVAYTCTFNFPKLVKYLGKFIGIFYRL